MNIKEYKIEWFIYDNECGGKGLAMGIEGDMRKINTVSDYICLVEQHI